MKLNYNEKELHQLLQDFHDLTKLTHSPDAFAASKEARSEASQRAAPSGEVLIKVKYIADILLHGFRKSILSAIKKIGYIIIDYTKSVLIIYQRFLKKMIFSKMGNIFIG